MIPSELLAGLKELAAEVGPHALANIYLAEGEYMSGHATASLRPEGTLGKVNLSIKFSAWDEILPGLRAAWDEHRELHESNVIKAMAVAVITLTAEHGECSDSALRAEFTQQDIDRYGDRAAALATDMGGNGPFEIVRYGAGNMPVDEAA